MPYIPCFIIPIYNHKDTIRKTVDALQPYALPIVIVDDGSDEATQATLAQLSGECALVSNYRLPHNQGKGAAVSEGIKRAYAKGFTHGLQIDADGQHNTDDIPAMLTLAQENPLALVCGQPLFDDSAPKGRLWARKITHFWVSIETLSLSPYDTMCGFRVYPINTTHELANEQALGRRMDFDTEVMVRLLWQGVDIKTIDTRVIYPRDGISHFDYIKDNVLITKMHTRLVFGMLWRLPLLLKRKLTRRRRQALPSVTE